MQVSLLRVASVRKSAEGRPDSKLKLKVFQEHKKGSKSLKLDRRDGRRNRKSHQDCSGIQIRDPPFRSLKTPNRSSQNKSHDKFSRNRVAHAVATFTLAFDCNNRTPD